MERYASPSRPRRSGDSYGLGAELQSIASRTGRASVVPDPFGETTLDPAHPREWNNPVMALSLKVYRQILGLNPFKSSYFTLYTSLESRWDQLVALIGVLCAIAAGIPIPIISVIFGKLIDSFPPTEDEIHTRISQLLGVAVAYFVVTSVYCMSFGWTSEKISIRLRHKLLDCLLHLDQAYMDTHDMDVNSMLTEKIDLIHTGCSEKVGIFIQSISYFVAAFVVGFILSPKLTGILLAAVIPTMVAIVWITSTNIAKFSKRAAEYDEKANAVVESALRSVRVVQAFDMMAAVCEEHLGLVRNSVRASVRKSIVSAFQVGSIFFTAHAINGLAFYVGSRLLATGQSGGSAGTVFAVVLLILDSSFVVAQFAPFMDIFARAASAREGMGELFEAREAADKSRAFHQKSTTRSLAGSAVTFTDTTFSYPARPAVPVLNGLNLTIQPGTFTAIVGTSGGGKSTLISLLTGLYDYSGSITIGGDQLRGLNLENVRSQIAVVEQDPVLFSGTIYDNICNGLARQNLSKEEMDARCEEAVKLAAVDFLPGLPKGVHTHVGNELQLSGGQKQRICLARALIGKPAVLIADEPTSALDARSEVLVVESIKRAAAAGTTVIMIAHRLSTVLDADRIAVVSDGKVVEEGTPKELSEAGNVFKGLLNAQNTNLDRRESINEQSPGKSEAQSEGSLDKKEDDDDDDLTNIPEDEEAPPSPHQVKVKNSGSHFWKIIRPESPLIAFGLMASTVAGGILIGEAIIFGNLVSLLNTNVQSPSFQGNANFFCLMFFVLACIALASWVSSGTAFGISSARCVTHVRTMLLTRFLYLDMEWFAQKGHSVHELLGAFTKDAGDLSCLSGAALGTIFTTMTSVVGGIILAHVVAWKIAVVLLSAVPVMLVAGFLRLRVLGAADARRRTAYTLATSLAAEACRSRRTVAVFGLEDPILNKYAESLDGPYRKSRWFTAWSNVLLAVSFAVTYFVYSLAYWWGARQVREGMYSQREFFIVLPALLFSAQSSGQLFSLSPEIARAKAAFRNIFRLLSAKPHILQDEKDKIKSAESLPSPTLKANAGSDVPRIAFDRVTLSYPGREGKTALRGASLMVAKGQTIAFVGPSGAGKSTTVSLIERFYDTTAGTVSFDGTDIRRLDIRHLRDKIGLVSQEPDLLPGSVAYNIRLGASSSQTVSDVEIETVCKQCGLHDFISSLPEGYNTECGSSGSSKLSGGQKQRVALARALIRKPEVLLLDEPTSALDAHSERQVQAALNQAVQGRTTIIVAHRLASIQDVDKIYVFDEGRVVEEGKHQDLVALGGLYASMAKAQSLV